MSRSGELRRRSWHDSLKGELRKAAANIAADDNKSPTDLDVPQVCCLCSEDLVTGLCLQCEEYLCTRCTNVHMKGKATRDHTISNVTPVLPKSGEAEDETISLTCRFHSSLPISGLCTDCKKLVCANCTFDSHPEHNVIALEKSKRTLQVMCFDAVEILNGCRQDLDKIQSQTQDGRQKLASVCEAAKIELQSRKEKLVKEMNIILELAIKGIDDYNSETKGKYEEIDANAESLEHTVKQKLNEMNSVPSSHNIEMMAVALNNFNMDASHLYRDCTKCLTKLRYIPQKDVVEFNDGDCQSFKNEISKILAFGKKNDSLSIPAVRNRLGSNGSDISVSSGIGSALSSSGSSR